MRRETLPPARPRSRSRRARAVAALLASVASVTLAGCSATAPRPGSSGDATTSTVGGGTLLDRPLPQPVLDTPLVDQAGRTVTIAGMHGKTVVLTDFLTLCQEICPLTSVNLARVDDAVAAAGLSGQVEVVEATVDPARDTPARLAAYQKVYGARPNWSFLTGKPADLAALWAALGVFYQKVGEDPGAKPTDWLTGKPLTYDVDHQDAVFVIGPDGHEKWIVQGTPDTRGRAVPQPLASFLSGQGRSNLATPGADSWTAEGVLAALSRLLGRPIPSG